MMEASKAGWRLFRCKLPAWQEAYMDRLNKEYIAILCGEGNPSSKFWALEKRIKEDKKSSGVRCETSRTDLLYLVLGLLHDGAITFEDLREFSDSLKDAVQVYLNFMKG